MKTFQELQQVTEWAQFLLLFVPAINKEVLMWLVGFSSLSILVSSDTAIGRDAAAQRMTTRKRCRARALYFHQVYEALRSIHQTQIPQAQRSRICPDKQRRILLLRRLHQHHSGQARIQQSGQTSATSKSQTSKKRNRHQILARCQQLPAVQHRATFATRGVQ